ncbi:type II toxin-antitoxin system HicB family antitoxin [candidate division WWE3 bacterium CG_4_9_14_3_um_filter_43_9]|uniref:Type II toxin-antitoxin system HicB family antitoxin n=1 Tax=candidate division WWE3 bacterium CG_4_9_14_3_um_filter_43_9 TaxID=1975082 RepID=A0A2M7WZ54_UNCKA|nr:MAG: type II toxin-antitoxin system HicB family antitoxin [candidate division WWE3 bacterium CG_4_9_14_3_um_filter_43_9]
MKIYTFRTIIEKDAPGYHGYVPSLPGCHTYGITIEETKSNLKEAILCHLESLLLDKQEIPQEESLEVIQTVSEQELKINSHPQSNLTYA